MIFRHQYHLEMIDLSSKMNLKMSCLKACDNDVARAKTLYEFLISDIQSIPDVDPVRPSAFEQVKMGASDVVGWITSHKDDIAQGISFIQSIRGGKANMPIDPPPPIPKI